MKPTTVPMTTALRALDAALPGLTVPVDVAIAAARP